MKEDISRPATGAEFLSALNRIQTGLYRIEKSLDALRIKLIVAMALGWGSFIYLALFG